MAREEGTYMLMVDVFYGQRVLCFPLSYYDGKAYLLGLGDDYCGPFGQSISNFGLLNEEGIYLLYSKAFEIHPQLGGEIEKEVTNENPPSWGRIIRTA